MWVPGPTVGVWRSARSIAAPLLVSGSTTLGVWSNSITPSCWFPTRRPASARAATIALSSEGPFMLGLTSIASTMPKSSAPARVSGVTTALGTVCPFSRRCTSAGATELRPETDSTSERAVGGDRLDLEAIQLLQRDHVGLHSLDLGDRYHLARAVVDPLEVQNEVDGRCDLLADRPQRQVVAGHQHHRLQARERISRRVGVHGGERAVVARVQRLQHVQRLGTADLAHDDAVGAHAQGVTDEVADRDLALALDVLRPALQAQHVALHQPELGRVLDRDDALGVGDRG